MRINVLGSGTSTGVPIPGCNCEVCTSDNPKNNRLRVSLYIELCESDRKLGGDEKNVVSHLLIDTATDLRQQALRAGITKISSVLYTHTHADHTNGLDDLRAFNFINRSEIPVYASSTTATELRRNFRYAFEVDPNYEGGAPPRLSLCEIEAYKTFEIAGVEILPLPVLHGRMEVFAYRIGNFAYLTDCSSIPEETYPYLRGLEVLILDGLRNRPHKTHFTHEQAVAEVEKIRPKKTYLTHISHEVEHEQANARLRELTDLSIELAYDGLLIEVF